MRVALKIATWSTVGLLVVACGSGAAPAGTTMAGSTPGPSSAAATVASEGAGATSAVAIGDAGIDTCPITVDRATEITGQPMQVTPAALGDGTFIVEEVSGLTTANCSYTTTADPSVSSYTLHMGVSTGASATGRWDILASQYDDPVWASTDRLGGSAWERVFADEPGRREVALVLHGDGYLIDVDAAAYGGEQSLDQVRAAADAIARASLEAAGVPAS